MNLSDWKRQVSRGYKIREILWLDGPQGSGKTHWLSKFCRDNGLNYCYLPRGNFNYLLRAADIIILERGHIDEINLNRLLYSSIISVNRKGKIPIHISNHLNFIQEGGDKPVVGGRTLRVDMRKIYPYCKRHQFVKKVCGCR